MLLAVLLVAVVVVLMLLERAFLFEDAFPILFASRLLCFPPWISHPGHPHKSEPRKKTLK